MNKDLEERSFRLTTGEGSKRSQNSGQFVVLSEKQNPEKEERKESFTNRSKRSLVDGIKSILSEIRKSMSSQERSDKGSAKGKQETVKPDGFVLDKDSESWGS